MVLGLETTCNDSDPFNSFTLTCTASKPEIVLPELELLWLHNGTVRSSNSFTYNQTSGGFFSKFNVLQFPTSVLEDSGSYECVAHIVIPDSANISETGQTNVTIRGWLHCIL